MKTPQATQNPKRILLSFVGTQDPFSARPGDDGNAAPGPVLTLLASSGCPFDGVVLYCTNDPAQEANARKTAEEAARRMPGLKTECVSLDIEDPTSYEAILKALRPRLAELQENEPTGEFCIAAASGTPAMHACWFLLAASGEIPARILNIRQERFVRAGQPLVSEINPRARIFPDITPNLTAEEMPEARRLSAEILDNFKIVADHPKIRKALDTLAKAAYYDSAVLLLGETGTGKGLFAKLLHELSQRREKPFIAVNCGAIPANLVESELFGHMKGAFTDAKANKKGKFELAHNGILFLDEIGELPPASQVKLLHALQDRKITPVGGTEAIPVDVRIITATNRDLRKLIASGGFRDDLYYRIKVVQIELPPLRERRSDIPKLAQRTLAQLNQRYQTSRRFTSEALSCLRQQAWEGNVRELENCVESAFIAADNEQEIRLEHLQRAGVAFEAASRPRQLPDLHPGFNLASYLDASREDLIQKALEMCDQNGTQAAKLLGVTPQAISKHNLKKMKPSL